ncbi:MAG: c-type cytochrome [Gammaproteobacteria bacterium]|jgi:cytochrome c556
MKNTFLALLCLLVTGPMSIAMAADEDPNLLLIEARQGEMELRSFSAGPLFYMAKGKIPYDAEQAAKLANNLKVLLQLDIGAAWAADTGNDKYPGKTEARPEIWSTYPEVAERGKEYAHAVNELAAVAGDGLDALRAKIGGLGDACKGCHDDFREKE